MNILSWFNEQKKQQPSLKFIPKININPKSTLYIQVQPKDPTNCSNIVITAFASQQVRSIVPIRVQWSRFKIKAEAVHSVEKIHCLVGNTYMCEPGDVGGYIKAVVRSVDQSLRAEAEVTIGPISIDSMMKRLIQGALYSGSLLSQIVICQKDKKCNISFRINTRTMEFTQQNTQEKLVKDFTMSQPKIQLNPKDSTRVYLRFEQDQTNIVREWLNTIFKFQNRSIQESSLSIKVPYSNNSSSASRLKLFQKSTGPCINKMELRFISRNSRDLFLFTQRAFICREDMKNSLFLQRIETLHNLTTQEDYYRFLSYMSLKHQILRLSDLAKDFEDDRNAKVKDLVAMEESIGEMTLTYLKIIEQKGKHDRIDFQHSYSQISIAREQMMNKKQLRELKTQNEKLRQKIRTMDGQIELLKFYKIEDNQSMIFNQTSNPFNKNKNEISGFQINVNSPQNNKGQNKNMYEVSISNAKLLQQNNELKRQLMMKKKDQNNFQYSQNMIQLLGDLDQKQDGENRNKQIDHRLNNLLSQNQQLKKKIDELLESNQGRNRGIGVTKSNKSMSIHQISIANSTVLNQSAISSVADSSINQSITSEAAMMRLEQNLRSLSTMNAKLQQDNTRLRRERDHYKNEVNKLQNNRKQLQTKPVNKSNYMNDNSMVFRYQQENQMLQNQKNALLRKIQSLSKESAGSIREEFLLRQKKLKQYEQLIDKLKLENISLSKEKQNNENNNEEVTFFTNQNIKLKKINSQLLEQIKTLKIQMEMRSGNLYNSRVIEMENELNFFKSNSPDIMSSDSNKLIDQINQLTKTNTKLKQENQDKQSKLDHQTLTIEKLMRETTKVQNSPTPKYSTSSSSSTKQKAYSQKCNQATVEELQKYKRQIKKLQEQLIFMKKSSDAINRSRDLTLQMDGYYQEKTEVMKKQLEALYLQNQNLSKMCQRYGKDAREANKELNKWREKAMDLMKARTEESSLISNDL